MLIHRRLFAIGFKMMEKVQYLRMTPLTMPWI